MRLKVKVIIIGRSTWLITFIIFCNLSLSPPPLSLSLSLSLSLPLSLSLSLSFCRSIYLPIYLSVCLSIHQLLKTSNFFDKASKQYNTALKDNGHTTPRYRTNYDPNDLYHDKPKKNKRHLVQDFFYPFTFIPLTQ